MRVVRLNSNTKLRIYSGLVIMMLIALVLFLGKEVTQLFTFLVGILITDEILINFFKLSRKDTEYKLSNILYLIFVAIFFGIKTLNFSYILITLNIIQNLFLLFILFQKKSISFNIFKALKNQEYLTSLFVFLPIHSMVFLTIAGGEKWILSLAGLILLVGSSDVMGWFVGRNIGKRKLWPSISPKKTIEGALGSLFFGVLFMCLFWHYVLDQNAQIGIVIFPILVILTILGDLVQSKFKRTFSIKDSSSMIPGHGGIYDRTDSVLFVAPFYCILLLSSI